MIHWIKIVFLWVHFWKDIRSFKRWTKADISKIEKGDK